MAWATARAPNRRPPDRGDAGPRDRHSFSGFSLVTYNSETFPFELDELRGLDEALAIACLEYLNYDRLRRTKVHEHLPGGAAQLQGWMKRFGLWPEDWR